MLRGLVLSVTERDPVRRLVTETAAGRAVAERFVAGDTLDDAVAVARRLNDRGMVVSLDHLGEHVTTIGEADAATKAYLACIDAIESWDIDGNISVKLTQLGMGLDDRAAVANLDALAAAAARIGRTVSVDMEESAHTAATIDIYEQVQRSHGNLGIAIQAYLHRSAADLDRIIPLGGHVRLCKGAYAEPDEIAYQGRDVDLSFDRLATMLMLADDVRPAIATHDDERIATVLDIHDRRSGPWEFQMLYGVRRDRQEELARLGHTIRVYVPYGSAWYPYLTRRMAERPANMAFFLRALAGR